jgi:hypothetical protein
VRPALAIAATLAPLTVGSLAMGGPASASARSDALALAFQTWCLNTPPSFEALDMAAANANLRVDNDHKTDTPAEGAVEVKLWTVHNAETGDFALTGGLTVKGAKRVTVCGVAAPDLHGQELFDTLSEPARLGPPLGTRISEDGGARITAFKSPFAHTTIVLTDGTPQAAEGVVLNITEVRESGR